MAKVIQDAEVDFTAIASKRVAVIGYGSQGHAHALNLRDSGIDVRVAVRPESRGWRAAEAAGFIPMEPASAVEWAEVIVLLIPDLEQPRLYADQIAPHLNPSKTLMFAHGFAIRFGGITPPAGVDVTMVAPKAPGHRVREVFTEGAGTPALVAVHQNATGQARQIALAYAKALGCTRAGVIETTFAEETETDLFGEQAVLCGGVSELVTAGFETLIEAGYQPEVAYFECLHELKLIVDLMYRGGLTFMWHSVSDTAEHGGYTAGSRVITEETRKAMRQILADVRSGRYAETWASEHRGGLHSFTEERAKRKGHLIEHVGEDLRRRMAFLQPPANRLIATP